MNCHHARQLISPYLDQQLTGREMLVLQDHFGGCASCEREMQSIRQVKALLRGLREPGPPRDFSHAVALRLAQADARTRRVLYLPSLTLPQRGRRLAGALVLSCFSVVSFALPFAPEARQAARFSSPMFGSGFGSSSAGSSPFGAASESEALLLGRVPERVTLTSVNDLTHLSPAEPSAAGALALTGMTTPPLEPGMELSLHDVSPHDAPFGKVQFAEFRSR